VDVPTAVTTALRSLAGLRALQPQFKEAFRHYDVHQLDKLETYAQALVHAHTRYMIAALPAELLPELIEQATRLRDMLLSDVTALVNRGMLDSSQLRNIKSSTGYRPLAVDLAALAELMTDNWKKVKTKTAVEEADLETARDLSMRIFNAVSQREQAPTLASEATLQRQRAYTLFFQAYDHARKLVMFVRWAEDDAEKFVPSLHAGRSASKRRTDAEPPAEPPVVASPGLPAGIPPLPSGAPGLPVGIPTPVHVSVPTSPAIPVGLPGSDPFVRA
jgi:hypothetical protein